jgi:formate dehydrogenase subunit delta
MKRFWDPRMRKAIVAHLDSGGDGLSDLAREAVSKLR